MIMDKRASHGLFFLFLSLLFWCSSGTSVGFCYHARGRRSNRAMAFLEKHLHLSPSDHDVRVFVSDREALSSFSDSEAGSPLDLYLNQNQLERALTIPKPSSLSRLIKTHFKTVVAKIGHGDRTERLESLDRLLPALKSVHSVLTRFDLHDRVTLAVAFPFSLLDHKMPPKHERELCRVLSFVKSQNSSVIIEAAINDDEELVKSALQKANSVASIFPCDDIAIPTTVLTLKTHPITNPKDISDLTHRLSKALEEANPQPKLSSLYIHPIVSPNPRRELLTESRDTLFTPPPTIVTVNPTPVTVPNPEVPIVTAPPVTNPVASPASNGGGAGGTWCVAKPGASEAALQAALDYACGAGADCSQLQQGSSCSSPETLQSHASYAFNSYYQKSPLPTSCNFGGVAALTNANPSTGSCVYASSASSSAPTMASPLTMTPLTPTPPVLTPPPMITNPATVPAPMITNPATVPAPTITNPATVPAPTITNPATIPTPSWSTAPGSVGIAPPSLSNTSADTGPEFGLEGPPGFSNTSTSSAGGLKPSLSLLFLLTSLAVIRKIVLV